MDALPDPALQLFDLHVEVETLDVVEFLEQSPEDGLALADQVRFEALRHCELCLDAGHNVLARRVDQSLGRLDGEVLVLVEALQDIRLEADFVAIHVLNLLL